MTDFIKFVFNVELALILDVITAFILGALLFLIKVPSSEYARKIAKTKNTIATCYMVCFALFYVCLRYTGMKASP